MAQRINNAEKQRLPQFLALLSKGVSFNEANRIVKAQTGRGIRGEVAGRILRNFRAGQERSLAALPTQRSQRITRSMAQPMPFKSKSVLNIRYLLDVQFEATNPLTGESQIFTNTIGLERLDRRGVIDDLIQERLQALSDSDVDKYVGTFTDINFSSANISGLYSIQ